MWALGTQAQQWSQRSGLRHSRAAKPPPCWHYISFPTYSIHFPQALDPHLHGLGSHPASKSSRTGAFLGVPRPDEKGNGGAEGKRGEREERRNLTSRSPASLIPLKALAVGVAKRESASTESSGEALSEVVSTIRE